VPGGFEVALDVLRGFDVNRGFLTAGVHSEMTGKGKPSPMKVKSGGRGCPAYMGKNDPA